MANKWYDIKIDEVSTQERSILNYRNTQYLKGVLDSYKPQKPNKKEIFTYDIVNNPFPGSQNFALKAEYPYMQNYDIKKISMVVPNEGDQVNSYLKVDVDDLKLMAYKLNPDFPYGTIEIGDYSATLEFTWYEEWNGIKEEILVKAPFIEWESNVILTLIVEYQEK